MAVSAQKGSFCPNKQELGRGCKIKVENGKGRVRVARKDSGREKACDEAQPTKAWFKMRCV